MPWQCKGATCAIAFLDVEVFWILWTAIHLQGYTDCMLISKHLLRSQSWFPPFQRLTEGNYGREHNSAVYFNLWFLIWLDCKQSQRCQNIICEMFAKNWSADRISWNLAPGDC